MSQRECYNIHHWDTSFVLEHILLKVTLKCKCIVWERVKYHHSCCYCLDSQQNV